MSLVPQSSPAAAAPRVDSPALDVAVPVHNSPALDVVAPRPQLPSARRDRPVHNEEIDLEP